MQLQQCSRKVAALLMLVKVCKTRNHVATVEKRKKSSYSFCTAMHFEESILFVTCLRSSCIGCICAPHLRAVAQSAAWTDCPLPGRFLA
eukprot:1138270-Pelagomonas_calceolata.AAC.2